MKERYQESLIAHVDWWLNVATVVAIGTAAGVLVLVWVYGGF